MDNELSIIERIKAGEKDLFEQLVSAHKSAVFGLVSKMIPASDIPEVAQEVFIRAYKSLSSYKAKAPFRHWLSRIAVNTCHDHWRSTRARRQVQITQEHWNLLEQFAAIDSYETAAADQRVKDTVEIALAQLAPADRLAFVMRYLDEKPLEEITKALNWSMAQTKIRLFRARNLLRKYFKEHGME